MGCHLWGRTELDTLQQYVNRELPDVQDGFRKGRGTRDQIERLLWNHANIPGFLAPGGEEFNPGPEMRLDRSELLCNKVLLKYKGDRESF